VTEAAARLPTDHFFGRSLPSTADFLWVTARVDEWAARTPLSPRWGWISSHVYPRLTPWTVFFRHFAARNRWPCSTLNLQNEISPTHWKPRPFKSYASANSLEPPIREAGTSTDVSSSPASSVDRTLRPLDIRASARLRVGSNVPHARCARFVPPCHSRLSEPGQ